MIIESSAVENVSDAEHKKLDHQFEMFKHAQLMLTLWTTLNLIAIFAGSAVTTSVIVDAINEVFKLGNIVCLLTIPIWAYVFIVSRKHMRRFQNSIDEFYKQNASDMTNAADSYMEMTQKIAVNRLKQIDPDDLPDEMFHATFALNGLVNALPKCQFCQKAVGYRTWNFGGGSLFFCKNHQLSDFIQVHPDECRQAPAPVTYTAELDRALQILDEEGMVNSKLKSGNWCEHDDDHEAPVGYRFCSPECERCEHESAEPAEDSIYECDGLCGLRLLPPLSGTHNE